MTQRTCHPGPKTGEVVPGPTSWLIPRVGWGHLCPTSFLCWSISSWLSDKGLALLECSSLPAWSWQVSTSPMSWRASELVSQTMSSPGSRGRGELSLTCAGSGRLIPTVPRIQTTPKLRLPLPGQDPDL